MGTHPRYQYRSEFNDAVKEHLAQLEGTPISAFSHLLNELSKLNPKYLQQLLSDLNSKGSIDPFHGEYHRMLINHVENVILERTVLK